MRKVVYTCLFSNGKRKPDEPYLNADKKLSGYDYIIFTNIPDRLNNSGWTCVYKDLVNEHPIYTAKHYKWLSHKYLLDYDIAIYVDAYMSPSQNKNWDNYCDKLKLDNAHDGMITMKHSSRKCIYDECAAIQKHKKDTKEHMENTIKFLENENMPKNYGLPELGVFMRHLKNDKLNILCEELFSLMLKFTYRDQALMSYVFWKHGETINCEFSKDYCYVSGKIGNHNYV